jgi:hypothetical protein
MKDRLISRRDKIISSVAVAAFFVLTILVFAPGHLFLTNLMEFNADYLALLDRLLLIALPVFVLISVVLVFLPAKYNIHQKVVVLLFTLAFLLWLQGNYIVWRYGVLAGGKIEFNTLFLLFDGAIWVAAVVIAWIKSRFVFRWVRWFSIGLIVAQVISTSIMVSNMPDISDLKRYEVDESNKFVISEENNVIILLLDTFQSDVFQEIIDEDEFYKDIFDGFVYYRDTACAFPTTIASAPSILTGQYFDNSVSYSEFLKSAYLSSNSLPAVLLANGFEVDCFGGPYIYKDEQVMSNLVGGGRVGANTLLGLYDAAFFRYLPDVLKNCVYRDGKWALRNLSFDEGETVIREPEIGFDESASGLWDIAFIKDMLSRADTVEGKPVFKYYWLAGCHQPYLLNEALEYEEMDNSMESYERQAKGSLKVVKLFLDELKDLGVYDNSMVLIMGDHGIFHETLDIRGASPLLLVKKYNSSGDMEVSNAPASLPDVPATVFSELGLEGQFSGEDIFDLDGSTNRTRTYYFYDWFSSGFADWSKEYLPPMKKYLISGPVYLEDSWRMSDEVFIYEPDEDLTIEWQAGFSVPKVGPEGPWVWGSSNGTMVIVNNTTEERRCIFSAAFSTGYDEPANLSIKGDLIDENLVVDRYGYDFRKEILVTPGRHYVDFLCDARQLDLPDSPSSFVFKVEYFKISEYTSDAPPPVSDLLIRWTDGFSFLEEDSSGGNWRWCSSQGTLVLTNTSDEDMEYRMSATFWTGYPDPANLVIESALFSDDLTVNNAAYGYVKEFVLPPGRHVIHFTCDAEKVDAPSDWRTMVFCVGGFRITEVK